MFRVNTATPGDQTSPSVASDADGEFVIVWQGPSADENGNTDVFLRRYGASGLPLGGEVVPHASTAGPQRSPSVAMDADGDFVVVWISGAGAEPNPGIFGQRYSATGAPLGERFRIYTMRANQFGAFQVLHVSVAMSPGGRFAVTWDENDPAWGPHVSHIPVYTYARLFDASGEPLGPQFLAHEAEPNFGHALPSVAIDDAGNVVVAWTRITNVNTVYARRFDPTGAPRGAQFRVAPALIPGIDSQDRADVAFDRFGRAVISWQDDNSATEVNFLARQFDPNGVALGDPIRVAQVGKEGPPGGLPSVCTDATGGFVVAWNDQYSDSAGGLDADFDVFARRYDAAGAPLGNLFQVNSYNPMWQISPSVASDADGDLVIAWESTGQDGSGQGIYAQRYDESGDRSPPIVTGLSIAGESVGTAQSVPPASLIQVQFSERLSTAGGAAGSGSVLNPASWQLIRAGAGDVSSLIQSVSFGTVDRREQATLHLSSALPAGDYVLIARDTLHDPAANLLDGDADGAPGGALRRPFSVVNTPPTTLGIPGVTVAEDEDDTLIPLGELFDDTTDPDSALTFTIPAVTNPALFGAVSVAGGVLRLDFAPDANGSSSVTVRATDSGGLFVEATFLVTVLPVNDAPVNTVPPQQFAAPGDPIVFRVRDGNGIRVSDVDGANQFVTVGLETTPRFQVVLARSNGLDVTTGPRGLQMRGLIADVNAALDGMQLIPDGRLVETTSLTITTADEGGGIGAPMADVDTLLITFDERQAGVSIADVTVVEGNSGFVDARFTVRLSGGLGRGMAVSYATGDGTAREGIDYGPDAGRIEFAPDETEKIVTMRVYGDARHEPDETFFVTLTDPSSGLTVTDDTAVGTIVNDDAPGAPPAVTQVFVSGTTWKPAFKLFLAAQALGDATFGYAIPAGAAQLVALPWGNINQISVCFSTEVFVLDLDLVVKGVNVPGYPVIDFTYDEPSLTATWTLAKAVRNDKLLLVLDGGADGVTDPAGTLLDGEWTTGADAYPSGNGAPGEDFRFRVNVLAGDASRSGTVDATDWVQVRQRQRRSTAAPGAGSTGYSVFHDLDGSGLLDSTDLLHVRRNLSRVLPGAEPSTAPASALPVLQTGAERRRSAGTRSTYELPR